MPNFGDILRVNLKGKGVEGVVNNQSVNKYFCHPFNPHDVTPGQPPKDFRLLTNSYLSDLAATFSA